MSHTHTFTAIGTTWSVVVEGDAYSTDAQEAVEARLKDFETRFSRFLPESEVNQFRQAEAGTYPISEEFAILLARAALLRDLTDGVFDPAAGALLERAGYDASYSLTPTDSVEDFVLPQWELSGTTLMLDGPTNFDLGGIGKGYAIDAVAALLRERGYQHFLVDAGGDLFGTQKADGAPWRIAIEYPGEPDTAAGVIELKDQGLAVSDTYRRRWGKWHHLIDPVKKEAVQSVIGAAAVGASAWDADSMTSALFLGHREGYPAAAHTLTTSYLVFNANGTTTIAPNWPGELFV